MRGLRDPHAGAHLPVTLVQAGGFVTEHKRKQRLRGDVVRSQFQSAVGHEREQTMRWKLRAVLLNIIKVPKIQMK